MLWGEVGVSLPFIFSSFLLKMLTEPDWALGSRGDSKGSMSLNEDFTFWTKPFDWQGHRLTRILQVVTFGLLKWLSV